MSVFSVGWGAWALIGLGITQVIIALVTVYFHRAVSHRALTMVPGLHRVCRFLSWFLIAMDPQEFAAVHRKHHAKCDTKEDPHSPVFHGWAGVLFGGLGLYQKEASNPDTIAQYGQGMFQDPWEAFYRRHKNLGILTFGIILTGLMGGKGLLLWVLCLLWIPFWAAGVVNGLGHFLGYRRFPTDDQSTNLVPLGLWIGGEELHNNHHAHPSSAKFSSAWYEFDLGWGWILVLRALGWVTVREPVVAAATPVTALLTRRYDWMRTLHASLSHDLADALRSCGFRKWRDFSRLAEGGARLSRSSRSRLEKALVHPAIAEAHRLELSLRDMWLVRRSEASQAMEAMEDWLAQARRHAGPRLMAFCDRLSGVSPVQAQH